jgi:predicted NUDIX family NTP pyrophosphohydrolase
MKLGPLLATSGIACVVAEPHALPLEIGSTRAARAAIEIAATNGLRMPNAVSAGVLLHRHAADGALLVFIGHPGGPYWRNRDDGAWTIPKGLAKPDDAHLEAVALREFAEEVGVAVTATLLPLGEFKQPSGKVIHVWHGSQDIDEAAVASNLFELEWPPKSGQIQCFPEIDRGQWFTIADARTKLLRGQVPILDALHQRLNLDQSR